MKTTKTEAEQLPADDGQPDPTPAKPKRAQPPKRRKPPAIPLDQKMLLTAAEVSALTGLCEDIIYDLGKAGILPSVRVGRAVRYTRKGVERWIDDSATGGV